MRNSSNARHASSMKRDASIIALMTQGLPFDIEALDEDMTDASIDDATSRELECLASRHERDDF